LKPSRSINATLTGRSSRAASASSRSAASPKPARFIRPVSGSVTNWVRRRVLSRASVSPARMQEPATRTQAVTSPGTPQIASVAADATPITATWIRTARWSKNWPA
jgi:hypothetical protein